MTISRIAGRLRREDEGFIMMVAVVLLAAVATLSGMVLSTGSRTDRATGRGRNWAQALHVAEAGLENAISRLQGNGASFAGTTMSVSGTTAEGSYTVTVTKQARRRFLIDSTGSVGTGSGLRTKRRIQATLSPPRMFTYALFSDTDIYTKNNDTIRGDVWANSNVTVEANDLVEGSITAATGWIRMNSNSRVTGDAWSGGFNPADNDRAIHLDTGAKLDGNAKASVSGPSAATCSGEDNTKYKVRLDGNDTQVGGSVTTWGTKTGPGLVGGAISQNVCTAAPAKKSLPTFSYSATNYDAATLREFGTPTTPSATAVSDFHTYRDANKTSFSGTFYVNQSGAVGQSNRLDLTNVKITGDTTIITNTPIFTNGNTDNGSDAMVVLVSTYRPPTGSSCDLNQDSSECSVHLKNNFSVSGATCTTAVLVYAPYGPVAVKNTGDMCGSIYSTNIQIKNIQTISYDERVDRVVGFGPVTLELSRWLEITA